jgi:para-nitrobenzyl esterase
VYAWTPEDYKVSEIMQDYFANFIKTGNPNGGSLPKWPTVNSGNTVQVMHLDVNTRVEPEQQGARYQFLNQFFQK